MKDREAYLAAVARALDCPRGMKRELLAGLRGDLAEFADDYDAVCARFGPPQAAAQELSSCIDTDQLLRRRRKIKIMIGSAIAVLCVLCGILFAYYLHARSILWGDFAVELRETTVYYVDENAPSLMFPELNETDVD